MEKTAIQKLKHMNTETKPKIFCFINAINRLGHIPCALAEDGECLAQHASSNETWAKMDIGIDSERKHDIYKAHYPNGYELVWLESDELETNEEFKEACRKNSELALAEEA